MYGIFLTLYILIAIALIVLVLIQHGKGADIGAAFGSGASNTVFGSQGSGGFLFKFTGWLATGFFALALVLGYMVNTQYRQQLAPVLPQSAPVKQQVVPLPENVLNNNTESKAEVAPLLPTSADSNVQLQ
jgi:preprotein translocase subunit SecG